jgi:hypothetical protein
MRDDMDEVIIERPRRGSHWGHRRRIRRIDPKRAALLDPESLPLRVGHHHWLKLSSNFKSLNENLAPLRRYLLKQVNRPWNKVWSEISTNLRSTNTVQQHVRDHVDDFVAIRTFAKDGVVWAQSHRRGPQPLDKTWYELYVDPRTGILRPNKHFRKHDRKRRDDAAAGRLHRATRMRELGPLLQLHRLDDNWWWEIRLAPIPTERRTYGTFSYDARLPFFDFVLDSGLTKLPGHELYGRSDVYAVAKRQLSRAEIGDLGLNG